MSQNENLYVMGDIHGQVERMSARLINAGLLDAELNWIGGRASLWFLGDYFDRGPSGIQVIELIIKLQEQASHSSGEVGALLGNHDIAILAADLFGNTMTPSGRGTFFSDWLRNGGNICDLDGFKDKHRSWISSLPTLALKNNRLLVHADALIYWQFGQNLAMVNETVAGFIRSRSASDWELMLDLFSQRRAFLGDDGPAKAVELLRQFGGLQIIHGHTPICKVIGKSAGAIFEPYLYAGGLCVNVDGGMYLGGPGFLACFPSSEVSGQDH